MGKTSLLQAGLFPRVRAIGLIPVPVRIDFSETSPPPLEQLTTTLEQALAAANYPRQRYTLRDGFWAYFHQDDPDIDYDALSVPLLVFDQFEEAFTLGLARPEKRAATQGFLNEFADLIENRMPAAQEANFDAKPELLDQFAFDRQAYRILIAIREDYLASLEMVRERAHSLGRNRLHLARMTGREALEAVRGPGGDLVSAPVAQEVVRVIGTPRSDDPFGAKLSGGDAIDQLDVEPSLLSLLCEQLNERRIARKLPEITRDLVSDNRDSILEDFYNGAFHNEPPALREFVEDELLSRAGHRETVALDGARDSLQSRGVSPGKIDDLVTRRLLRVEERQTQRRVEIIHDVLAPVILRSRALRRERQATEAAQRAAEEARKREKETQHSLRVAKRQRGGALAAAALFLAVIAVAVVFYFQAKRSEDAARVAQAMAQRSAAEAKTQAEKARQQTLLAQEQRRDAELSQTKLITEKLTTERSTLSPEQVVLIARAVLPADPRSPTERPFWEDTWKLYVNAAAEDQQRAIIRAPFTPFSAAAISADGGKVATAAADGTIALWDTETGGRRALWRGHVGTIGALAFSPDSKRLVSGGIDRSVKLWSIDGTRIGALDGQSGAITAVEFSPDGTRVVAASEDGTARLWDAATVKPVGSPLKHTAGVATAHFSSDGTTVLTGSSDGTAAIWATATGVRLFTLAGHRAPIVAAVFSPDGKHVATGAWDRTARLWNAKTGASEHELTGHAAAVVRLAFDPVGANLITGSLDGTARLWNVATGELERPLTGHSKAITAVSFVKNGKAAITASADGTIKLWTLDTRTSVTVGEVPAAIWYLGVPPQATASDPATGLLVSASDDGTARIWSLAGAITDFWSNPAEIVAAVDLRALRTLTSDEKKRFYLDETSPDVNTATSGESPEVDRCDALATDPLDPRRNSRVVTGFNALSDSGAANEARVKCAAAAARYPNESRFTYELGRALLAQGKSADADKEFLEAATANYPAAITTVVLRHIATDGTPLAHKSETDLLQQVLSAGDASAGGVLASELWD
ncbi:MAG TPA: WD40 repeat domain-containing protein, partial [Candidatus Baltobacteraceae bacterium]|nr:WD40 repeat domain-containing protein [Candidatus Baltobacteraceae bacterium]